MTTRWFERRLTHTCVVQRDSGTAQSSSGETTATWADTGTRRPCRYIEKTENIAAETDAAIMVKRHVLLMTGTSDVNVDDCIVRIWDEDDVAIHAGPFTVEEILARRDIRGEVHHQSLQLERVETS